MTFAVRRAREHAGRLSLLTLIVVLLVVGIGGIDAVSERLLSAGVLRMLDGAEPAARTIRVEAKQSEDGTGQDAAVRDAVATAFSDAEVRVSRGAELERRLRPLAPASAIRLVDDERLPGLSSLTRGAWPDAPGQIALPDRAAERLRLTVGDAIPLDGDDTALTLVATWRADDPLDSAWHGDPSVASGMNDGVIGPAIVAHDTLPASAAAATIVWEIAPRRIDTADIPALQAGLAELQRLPDTVDPGRQHNTRVLGDLGATLQRQAAAVAATRGLLVAPQLIIALLGALVLGIGLAALSLARAGELALLRARGASARRLATTAGLEAAGFAAAGALLALGLLSVTVGISTGALVSAAGALAFVLVASGLFVLRDAIGADAVRPEARRSDAGALPLPALLLPAGVAVGLAALSSWQLFAAGSVLRDDGTAEPLAAAAPALLLVAVCALAPLAAGPLAALAERLLQRSRGIAPILPLRQIARRMGSAAIAILCLALAAASLALAAAAPAAGEAAELRTRAAQLGGDVRMVSEDGLDTNAEAVTSWSGVTRAADVLRTPVAVGADTVDLIAGPPDVLGLSGAGADGTALPAVITRSLADRLSARAGTVFSTRIRSVADPVNIEVTNVVDTMLGAGDGWVIATSADALHGTGAKLPDNELWVRSKTPAATAVQLRAQATHPVSILTAAQVSAAPVTSVAPALLMTGALVAAALGAIGFVAASSAATRGRHGESLLLRALGLRPGQQRALRLGEHLGVAAYALIVGGVLGAVVAIVMLPVILGMGS